jgi:hypothetical protein
MANIRGMTPDNYGDVANQETMAMENLTGVTRDGNGGPLT